MVGALSAAGGLALAAAAAFAFASPAPQEVTWAEGLDLSNDAFLPTEDEAWAKVALGDAAWGDVRENGFDADDPPRAAIEAFEAWHAALELAGTGDSVPLQPFPAPEKEAGGRPRGPARATEGVELAVLRRLAALTPPARLAFRRRFETLAEGALPRGALAWPPGELLAAAERAHPLTPTAARAALAMSEVALEAGRPARAATWLDRAERHARLGGFADDAWTAALERRRAVVRGAPDASRASDEAWRTARELELVETFAFHEDPPPIARTLPTGVRPGAVFLDDGRVLVQTGDAIVALDPDDALPVTHFASELVESVCGWRFERPRGLPGGDWPCLPAVAGDALVVVAGYGDALLCLDVPVPGEPARMRWAVSEEGARRGGTELPPGAVLPEGGWDFQPGPVVVEDRVLVQARAWTRVDGASRGRTGKPSAELCCFDLATGELRWSRLLAVGSDVRSRPDDRLSNAGFGLPALPLRTLAHGTEVFAGTQLGVGALVETADGRLVWSLRNRRRAGDARGWNAAGLPPAPTACTGEASPPLIWAPADSDFLYWVAPGPVGGLADLLVRPPEPQEDARELLAGDACEVVVAARLGARAALARWDLATGDRSPALLLRHEEAFTGAVAASASRLLMTTDRGLYLLDRERELYLLQHLALTSLRPRAGSAGRPAGGSVVARGDRVAVVGHGDLWLLRVAR